MSVDADGRDSENLSYLDSWDAVEGTYLEWGCSPRDTWSPSLLDRQSMERWELNVGCSTWRVCLETVHRATPGLLVFLDSAMKPKAEWSKAIYCRPSLWRAMTAKPARVYRTGKMRDAELTVGPQCTNLKNHTRITQNFENFGKVLKPTKTLYCAL